MVKCKNCVWEGEETKGPLKLCPNCGDFTDAVTTKPVVKEALDLNGDGKLDEKDKSLAGKVLSKKFGKRRRKG